MFRNFSWHWVRLRRWWRRGYDARMTFFEVTNFSGAMSSRQVQRQIEYTNNMIDYELMLRGLDPLPRGEKPKRVKTVPDVE